MAVRYLSDVRAGAKWVRVAAKVAGRN
jgi:hypothetical protein